MCKKREVNGSSAGTPRPDAIGDSSRIAGGRWPVLNASGAEGDGFFGSRDDGGIDGRPAE